MKPIASNGRNQTLGPHPEEAALLARPPLPTLRVLQLTEIASEHTAVHQTAATPPIVTLHGVAKRFASGTLALDQLDLAIRHGEFVSLLGPSGCGKSTALRLIAGLGEPTRGSISWSGTKSKEHRRNKPEVGFVFQEPTLMPWATVFRNVMLPLE